MAPSEVHFRIAAAADVAAMAACRLSDPVAGPADPRMGAYFNGQHHPHQALLPRFGYVAVVSEEIVGYIAGHRTTRHGYSGEIQYLFVASGYRRRGVGTALVKQLADWFDHAGARDVCVCVDADNPAAAPFYESLGAVPFKRFWCGWTDISTIASRPFHSHPDR